MGSEILIKKFITPLSFDKLRWDSATKHCIGCLGPALNNNRLHQIYNNCAVFSVLTAGDGGGRCD